MKSKIILLAVLLAANICAVFAQDKIYKKDGDVVSAKIKSVATRTITYCKFEAPTGPEYTIPRNEVSKIVYQNGSEDVFDNERGFRARHMRHGHSSGNSENNKPTPGQPKVNYGRNIISLSPIQFSENGLGLGLSYERTLDRNGIIAFYMPVFATFNLNNGTYYDYNGQVHNGHQDMMTYIMPGIKIYPNGYGIVRYGVGPSIVIGTGEKSSSFYDPTFGTHYETKDHVLLGMMINNSLNINPNAHVYLGLELGMGFTYLNRVGGLNKDTDFLVQGGFKVGFRF